MRTVEMKVYKFDELSDSAKDKAREWFRGTIEPDDYAESVLDDANTIAQLFGLEIGTRTVKLMGGGSRQEPEIYFDLGRGSGVYFSWSYQYKPGALAAVKGYAGQDEALHKIVADLQAIQKKNFYQLQASGEIRDRSYNTCEVDRLDDKEPTADALQEVEDCIYQFSNWILSNLQKEYDYVNSDESVDENIRINEYEFTAEGEIM